MSNSIHYGQLLDHLRLSELKASDFIINTIDHSPNCDCLGCLLFHVKYKNSDKIEFFGGPGAVFKRIEVEAVKLELSQ